MTFLFRAYYLRNDQPRSVTFSARDIVDKAEFVRIWEKFTGTKIDKVESCGVKRFERPGYLKLVQPAPAGGKRSPSDGSDKEKVK